LFTSDHAEWQSFKPYAITFDYVDMDLYVAGRGTAA